MEEAAVMVRCWKCGMKLLNIESIGWMHPITDKPCEVKDGIEIHEADPMVRDYFLKMVQKRMEMPLFSKIKAWMWFIMGKP